MKKKNKVMVGALALLVMGTSSLAYFTDRTESTFNAKAGNLCLTHVDSDSDLLNMAPGDLRDISFEYKNEGSLAMDTRVTYMLSYELEDGKAGATEGKVVTLLDGDKELVTKEVGDGVAKVTVNEATIQGTADKVGEASLKKNLKLKLHESVANDFQDATFHIEVVVEGKQNKNDAKWEEINTEKITVRADELNVVRQSACNVGEVTSNIAYLSSVGEVIKDEWELKVELRARNPETGIVKQVLFENITAKELKEVDFDSIIDYSLFEDARSISLYATNKDIDGWTISSDKVYSSLKEMKTALDSEEPAFEFIELPEPGEMDE